MELKKFWVVVVSVLEIDSSRILFPDAIDKERVK